MDIDDADQQCSPVTQDVVQNTVAELMVDAPSSDIKDCIKAYEYGKNLKQLNAAFNQFSCECITDTLNYLHVPEREEYVKSSNVQTLVCRIQNLLPDICSICDDVYCVKNNDVSLLSCDICGQEIHRKCLNNIIGNKVTENDNISLGTLTKNQLMQIVNPLGIEGWVYICKPCRKNHIPDEKSGLKKKAKKSNADLQKKNEQPKNIITIHGSGDSEKASQKEADEKQPVCKFYLKKQCKHGMKGDGCDFSHPPICQKLLKFGHSNKGCRGRGCKSIHPKMCNPSLKRKECPYKNCKFYHVKGTKYVGDIKHAIDLTDPKNDVTVPPSKDNNNNFLGQEQSLQSVKLEILEAMDIKIATLMSCFQTPPGFQRNPMSAPPHLRNAQVQNLVWPPPQMQSMFAVQKPPNNYVINPVLQNQLNKGNTQHSRVAHSPQQAHV